jgi:8-oxo-dGTP pyrophosphatase MutT (NUDIX family)
MYTGIMKLLSVVFPVFREGDTHLILMGCQAPGKRMPGIRNGFGGKCEPNESAEDCAVREMREESGVELKKDDLHYIGTLIETEKEIRFYTVVLDSKIEITDNDEMVDVRWFDVERIEDYIDEMLPGDDAIMYELAHSLASPIDYKPFAMDKSDNMELKEATKNIFDKT